MRILAIETSCDETALAIVDARGGIKAPSFAVRANLVASQIKEHAPFGGVVPMIAKREHQKSLPLLLAKLRRSHPRLLASADLLAVTVGPGLEPALWTGIEFAKKLGKELRVPVFGANHLRGHLASFLLGPHPSLKNIFPAISLIVSGGHTILMVLQSLTKERKLGETRDDAAGEAFDKIGRFLGLPYPGGPHLEKLAKKGNKNAIAFPRPMLHHKNFDFSFSGLKTAVVYYMHQHPRAPKADVAASFQEAVLEVLVRKTFRAAEAYRARSVIIAGGVAANTALRSAMRKEAQARKLHFLAPKPEYNTDNAAMIAAGAYLDSRRGITRKLVARGSMGIA